MGAYRWLLDKPVKENLGKNTWHNQSPKARQYHPWTDIKYSIYVLN